MQNSRPTVLFVGPVEYGFPLRSEQAEKWDLLSGVLDVRIIGRGRGPAPDGRFTLIGPRWSYYPRLVSAIRGCLHRERVDAIVAQSPFEAAVAALVQARLRPRAAVVAEVHGDWRTAARLYGGRRRRVLAPIADRVARWGLRRADAIRAVSGALADAVHDETGRTVEMIFPAFIPAAAFLQSEPAELPDQPTVTFIGALQRVKGADLLTAAWPRVQAAVPDARLVVVGDGPQRSAVESLAARFAVSFARGLEPREVAAVLDRAWVLAVPSRAEGFGRVVLEAQARGRAVVASRVGGLPELTGPDDGILVEPESANRLADALIEVLTDRARAEALGRAGRERAAVGMMSGDAYVDATKRMIGRALAAVAR